MSKYIPRKYHGRRSKRPDEIARVLDIGKRCKEFRYEIGYTQSDVAIETGYNDKTVAGFEQGRNNNAILLAWYISKGMTLPRDYYEDTEPTETLWSMPDMSALL